MLEYHGEKYSARIKTLTPLQRMVHYMNERFAISLRRANGLPREQWTNDPILEKYKFTNVKRDWDYTSRWLIDNWYTPYGAEPQSGMMAAFARFFCLVPTFEAVGVPLSLASINSWLTRAKRILTQRQERGDKVFTSAYIIGGVKPGNKKVAWVIEEYLRPVHESGLLGKPWGGKILLLHDRLREFNGWGDFMTQEVILDLQRTFVLMNQPDTEKRVYGVAGPGAMRGLCRVAGATYDDVGMLNRTLARGRMLDLWKVLLDPANGLHPELRRGLTVHDVEFSLCEYDKYERVLWGQGTPKQLFKPRTTSEPSLL
jgi:hypothetical protein